MRLNMHGAFPVEAITVPPLHVVSYHSAPRDPYHWLVSQVMKDNVAYPIVTGLSKQDAKTLAMVMALDNSIGTLAQPYDEDKWWQPYITLENLQEVIGNVVLEVMSSGVSDDVKKRFSSTGEVVQIMNEEVLLWNTDVVNLAPFNPTTGLYDKSKPILSRWVFSIGAEDKVVLRTIPEVWVQQELEK